MVSPSAAVSVRSLSVYWSQMWSGSRRKAEIENKPIWLNRLWHGPNSSFFFSVVWIILPSHKNAGSSKSKRKARAKFHQQSHSEEDQRRTQPAGTTGTALAELTRLVSCLGKTNLSFFPPLLTKTLEDLLKMFNAKKKKINVYICFLF